MTNPESASTTTDFDPSQLPDWAQEVLSKSSTPQQNTVPAAESYAGQPQWPVLLSAAVVGPFLPRDLVTKVVTDDGERRKAELTILAYSERVNGADGPKWTLTQDARRSVLAKASKPDIDAAIAQTSTFSDPISVALREQISGSPQQMTAGTLPALEAARVAAVWLGDTLSADSRKLDELNRRVAFGRLLKPFCRMVGVEQGEGTRIDLTKMRFFGRSEQIGRLHDYVGGFFSSLKRSILGAERPMIVWGIGGVGKTTLIARFVLEQVENAQARYPFAYLDFDRAALSPRRPALLLAEMCEQLTAQFPELTDQMRDLQSKARALSTDMESSSENAMQELFTFNRLEPLLAQFRDIVDGHISRLESTFEFKRPFLLVLDTFEVVQYSDFDVKCIERFVQKLSPSKEDDGTGWTRLRLIISGRKRPERFLQGFIEIELGALDRVGSVQMLQALVQDAGRPILQDWAERLIDALIPASTQQKAAGLSPLRLRLLSDLFKSEPETDGNVIAQQLLDELQSTLSANTKIGHAMIDGVLIRRILDHVADWRVKRLADPGLVVRSISPAVILEVMALGTPKPGSTLEIVDGDTEDFEPWELSQEEAREIFEAFRNEVRLVESDASGLRHRQDVRQDMLPLIRARRPNRFMLLHRLAFEFFSRQLKLNAGDQSSRAEAIYHGLWREVPLEQIDQLWPKTLEFDARLDPSEFTDLPAARRYILAKTRQSLPESEIEALPRQVAVEWVVSRENTLLEDGDSNKVVRAVRAATGRSYEGLDAYTGTASTVARLLYRAGEWSDAQTLIARHFADKFGVNDLTGLMELAGKLPTEKRERLDDLLSLLRTWTTMSAKLGADARPLELAAIASDNAELNIDAIARVELLSYAALGHRMLKDRSDWSSDYKEMVSRSVLRLARAVPESLWRTNTRALRFAILAADGDAGPLLAAYFSIVGASSLDGEILSIAGRALSIAYEITGERYTAGEIAKIANEVQSSAPAADRLQALWREGRQRVVKAVAEDSELQSMMKKILVFDHFDWGRPFGNALSRFFGEERGEALRDALRQERFVADPISRNSAFDGPSIVQWATARGNLLRLAETVEQFADKYVSAPDLELASGGYPESVSGIAEALLLWHDVNLEAMGGIATEDDEPKPQPDSSYFRRLGSKPKKLKTVAKKKRNTKRRRKLK
jgi:hypothetical protein